MCLIIYEIIIRGVWRQSLRNMIWLKDFEPDINIFVNI